MATAFQEVEVQYVPRGAANDLFHCRDSEVLLSGPAGTGKSSAMVQKLHLALRKYPGAKGLLCRKVGATLSGTGLETYREALHELEGVRRYGGSGSEPPHFIYSNGSKLYWGGLSRASAEQSAPKIMSAQYDVIGVQQAEELTENDWENLTTRLRNGVMPYQQIIGDANPQAPQHWLKLRADRGQVLMLESRHEDNPTLFTARGEMTPFGRQYMSVLDNLTGVRYKRLRLGLWAAAEGIVYELNRGIHLIDTFDIAMAHRVICSVDFGWTNPGVAQIWALDGDGRMFLIRELYRTQRTFEWWVDAVTALYREFKFDLAYCDPSQPGMIEAFNQASIPAEPADNDLRLGIQEVQDRLRVAGDGLPRLFLSRHALVDVDYSLRDAALPTCTEQEFDSYVWPEEQTGRPVKEKPVDMNNHGMDAMRYAAMALRRPAMPYQWLSVYREQERQAREAEVRTDLDLPEPPVPFENPFKRDEDN